MICLSFFKLLHKVGNVFYKCESMLKVDEGGGQTGAWE